MDTIFRELYIYKCKQTILSLLKSTDTRAALPTVWMICQRCCHRAHSWVTAALLADTQTGKGERCFSQLASINRATHFTYVKGVSWLSVRLDFLFLADFWDKRLKAFPGISCSHGKAICWSFILFKVIHLMLSKTFTQALARASKWVTPDSQWTLLHMKYEFLR